MLKKRRKSGRRKGSRKKRARPRKAKERNTKEVVMPGDPIAEKERVDTTTVGVYETA